MIFLTAPFQFSVPFPFLLFWFVSFPRNFVKNFQGLNVFHCSVINVPCGLASASAATLIGYQTQKPLSTTFLFYYQSFLFSAPLFCGAENILAPSNHICKHYFAFSANFFPVSQQPQYFGKYCKNRVIRIHYRKNLTLTHLTQKHVLSSADYI